MDSNGMAENAALAYARSYNVFRADPAEGDEDSPHMREYYYSGCPYAERDGVTLEMFSEAVDKLLLEKVA